MRPCLLPVLLLALAGPAVAQHHDHASAPAAVAPTHRFATDDALRENMAAIRASVEGLDHYRHGHMGPDEARRLAVDIQARVRDIVARCTLEPDADAALHGVIVPLATHAAALEKAPSDLAPIAPMQAALDAYARQFDDPGVAANR